jgi:hypothetical protein
MAAGVMMQNLIVALLVACAAVVVARRLLPSALLQVLRHAAGASAQRLGWAQAAQRLLTSASARGGCAGGCSGCAAAAGPSKTPLTLQAPDPAARPRANRARILWIKALEKDNT